MYTSLSFELYYAAYFFNLDKEFKALGQTFRIYHSNTILWDKSGSSLIRHLTPVLNRTIVDAICKSLNKKIFNKVYITVYFYFIFY